MCQVEIVDDSKGPKTAEQKALEDELKVGWWGGGGGGVGGGRLAQ
jgi:hypothetical protein